MCPQDSGLTLVLLRLQGDLHPFPGSPREVIGLALEARVASTIPTEQMWVNLVLSPDAERVWRGTRHTQEELKAPRVPWDLKGAGLFLSWGEMGTTWGWSGAQLQQSQQAEQESKAQEWDTGPKSKASCAEIAKGALAAVTIHRCYTKVDIDVFTGTGRGAALI